MSVVTRRIAAGTTAASSAAHGASAAWFIAMSHASSELSASSNEVGLAALNAETGQIEITQMSDDARFTRTGHFLNIHPPSDAIFVDSTSDKLPSPLLRRVKELFDCERHFTRRASWNRDDGLAAIQNLVPASDVKSSSLLNASDKYYALTALAALIRWLENDQQVFLTARGINIVYITSHGTMFIDADTSRNLELISNRLTGKTDDTLFSMLNSCYTPMGVRLLKSNILQPSNVRGVIENRQEALAELMGSEGMLQGVQKALQSLQSIDLDRQIARLMQPSSLHQPATLTEHRITLCLAIKKVIQALPQICDVLSDAQAEVLILMRRAFEDQRLYRIQQLIEESLNDDSHRSGGAWPLKLAKLYAVKAEVNELLDVARTTHSENYDDIQNHRNELADEYALLSLSADWSDRGFRFVLSRDEIEKLQRGKVVQNLETGKSKAHFTTAHLAKSNARLLQAQSEVFMLSDKVVEDLYHRITDESAGLYSCSESIALLDMIASFAHISSHKKHYTRPEFGESMAVRSGKHPMLDRKIRESCIANKIEASDGYNNFHIIQGPNMSGKSTYLRQIGLLIIQAMLGCYVPAEYACFRLHDALLTRLSNDDSLEKSLSTFATEMASSAMIMAQVSHKSLVLIDELGRGTAPQEGIGLSHAIAESLLRSKAFVFFATHFQELAKTLGSLPCVQIAHLAVQLTESRDARDFAYTFRYKISEGPCEVEHYGLELAKLADLPSHTLERAQQVSKTLREIESQSHENESMRAKARRRQILSELKGRLLQTVDASRLDKQGLTIYLRRIQQETMQELSNCLRIDQGVNTSRQPDASVLQCSK